MSGHDDEALDGRPLVALLDAQGRVPGDRGEHVEIHRVADGPLQLGIAARRAHVTVDRGLPVVGPGPVLHVAHAARRERAQALEDP